MTGSLFTEYRYTLPCGLSVRVCPANLPHEQVVIAIGNTSVEMSLEDGDTFAVAVSEGVEWGFRDDPVDEALHAAR